jgi:hypothetical protein
VPARDEAVRGRAEIDADDIILLCRQLGFTTVTKALTWLSRPIQDGRSRRK